MFLHKYLPHVYTQIAHGVRYAQHMQAINMSGPILRQRRRKNGNQDSVSRAETSLGISCKSLCVCCCMACCTNEVVSVHLVAILLLCPYQWHSMFPTSWAQ